MRAKEVLYAVIGGIVGTVLTMAVGALAPLGAQDESVDLNARKITCRALDVVDEKGNLHAGLNFSEFGGSVFVVGKQGKGAEMHVTKYGGAVFVWGKEAKGGAAMHLDGFGGKVYVEGRGFKEAAMRIDEHGGRVSVEGEEGNELKKAAMRIDENGGEVYVKGNEAGARMRATRHGGAVNVWDKAGKGAARMDVNENGSGGFSSWDKNGNRLK